MANTNPLAALNIKELTGFKHIVPGELGNYPVMALNNLGINAISGVSNSSSTLSVGEMTVLGNTFRGLMAKTPTGRAPSNIILPLLSDPMALKAHALQVGIRVTQTAVPESQRGQVILAVYNQAIITPQPIAGTLAEDSSAYYEIILSFKAPNTIQLQAFVNKQLTLSATRPFSATYPLTLQISPGYFTVSALTGYTVMIDDMYVAELDYNDDGTVTPQLLGNLTLEPFTVASYTGDKHTNTKNQDIVTALSTFDPNNDMGVLAIKPVEQAASVTFNAPDITVKTILGASLNIVYKDSIAPNNGLTYQITEGVTQLPEEAITVRNGDVSGFTTHSKILTSPAEGGEWNADNLKFKLDMVNKERE